MMKIISLCVLVLLAGVAQASTVTGDPIADGWAYGGHSLSEGVYCRGNANYGFELYSDAFQVQASSMLEISDGTYSWLAGDTILGVGGRFTGITAAEAGWDSFSGNTVNALLTEIYGPGLQVKMGTDNATWSASTLAPSEGNGSGSTSNGGLGTVFFRTSRWFHATDPLLSQDTDTTWEGSSGVLMRLDKTTHIERPGTTAPNDAVARVIWQFDEDLNKPITWQLLLNTSLLDRTAPEGFAGLTPSAGNMAIWSIQDRNGAYTDAVGTMVPEPATLALLGLGGLILRRRKG